MLAHGKDIKAGPGIDFCAAGQGIVDFPHMLSRLKQIGYTGDLLLHGVYSEEAFSASVPFMRDVISRYMN